MERYLEQLLEDIKYAANNIAWPYPPVKDDTLFWISQEEDEQTALKRGLEDWTGINKDQLPPARLLNDDQIHLVFNALKKMLDEYNWSFVVQIEVPERIQYETIRENFDQEANVLRTHYGFFEACRPGTVHKTCSLGEYCHCAFFKEMFKDMIDEDLTPEEERARELEIEVNHIKKKYGDSWMKYYPYHLDPDHDDEDGNSHDYGMGSEDDDNDDWWRK